MNHLFSHHLFSGGTYEETPGIAALDEVAPRFRLCRRLSKGTFEFIEERPYSYTDAEVSSRYGAGEYIVSMVAGGREQQVASYTVARPGRIAQVSTSFFEVLGLGMLEALLKQEAVVRATPAMQQAAIDVIVDGWLSSLGLTLTPGPKMPGYISGTRTRWRGLLPTFHGSSDVQIYRAYLAGYPVADKAYGDHVIDAISKVRVACEKLAANAAMTADQNRGKWYLWLDDERSPLITLAPDNGEAALGERYQQYVDADLIDVEWKWARSVSEAIDLYETFGHPKVMGLDHDLGEGGTAMEFLRWLADSGHRWPKQWYVHSANPVGRANIVSFIRSWERCAQAEQGGAQVTLADGTKVTVDDFKSARVRGGLHTPERVGQPFYDKSDVVDAADDAADTVAQESSDAIDDESQAADAQEQSRVAR